MRHPDRPDLTMSFDLLKGLEITTGAQREHRYEKLKEQATDRGFAHGPLEHYFNSFGTMSATRRLWCWSDASADDHARPIERAGGDVPLSWDEPAYTVKSSIRLRAATTALSFLIYSAYNDTLYDT